jgi:neutral ceramidase
MGKQLEAGVAVTEITPPAGVWMAGFAQRDGAAEGVSDPLFAKVLVLALEEDRIALVSLDIIQFEHSLLDLIRRRVEERTGIPGSHLLINATHTHSGPAVCRFHSVMGPFEEGIAAGLVETIARLVAEADRKSESAEVYYGERTIVLGVNRRKLSDDGKVRMGAAPDRPYDPILSVLRVDAVASGSPLAVLFSHAMHPVILGAGHRRFSADYPGAACRTLSVLMGSQTVGFFLQGCCGNINPPWDDRSYGAVERIGSLLGREAVTAAEAAAALSVSRLDGISESVYLPLLAPRSKEDYCREAEAHLEDAARQENPALARVARGRADWAKTMAKMAAEGPAPREKEVILQAVRIGDLAISALQVEPFVETGIAIRTQSPFRHTITLGYTNGCKGYLPTADAYPEGGYEVIDSTRYYDTLMYAPEAEAMVVEKSLELLRSLAK